jgi:hypothetical protein
LSYLQTLGIREAFFLSCSLGVGTLQGPGLWTMRNRRLWATGSPRLLHNWQACWFAQFQDWEVWCWSLNNLILTPL